MESNVSSVVGIYKQTLRSTLPVLGLYMRRTYSSVARSVREISGCSR